MSLAGRKTIETVKYVSGTLLLCTVHPLYVYLTLPVVTMTLCYGQAEQIMEAIELYKEERLKLLEYEEECKDAGKKVRIRFHYYHLHRHTAQYHPSQSLQIQPKLVASFCS